MNNFGFFNDDSGKQSKMRLALFFVVFVTIMVWGFVSIKNHVIVDIPENILYLNISCIFGKVGQKYFETKEK